LSYFFVGGVISGVGFGLLGQGYSARLLNHKRDVFHSIFQWKLG